MTFDQVSINRLEWSRHGTTLEIGYYFRNPDDDELTLGSFDVTVENYKIEPLLQGIIKEFCYDIEKKFHEETDR